MMSSQQTTLKGKKVAFLLTDGFEQVEFTRPWEEIKNAGAEVKLISIKSGNVQGYNHRDKADLFPVDAEVTSVTAGEFDALVLPGGAVNPDTLRMNKDAVDFVKEFFHQQKPVAAICHGPVMLVEANVVTGKKLTSWPSVMTDLINAGALWVDEEVVVDNGLVTSRKPDDLDAFCKHAIEEIAEGKHNRQTASAA